MKRAIPLIVVVLLAGPLTWMHAAPAQSLPTLADSVGIAFSVRGGKVQVKSLQAWDMSALSLSPLK